MSLFGRLAFLFVAVPLLELLLLVQMGRWVGLWPTIALVLVTGFAGAALARLEGMRIIWRIRGELMRGRVPGRALLDGLAILLGGALLLTPGILTDLVGLAFLFPPTRSVLTHRIRSRLEARVREGRVQFSYLAGFRVGDPGPWQSSESPGEIIVESGEESRIDP